MRGWLGRVWIADQVRNDVGVVAGGYSAWRAPALWIPAFAGMKVKGTWNDGRPARPLWIADQVRNDVTI